MNKLGGARDPISMEHLKELMREKHEYNKARKLHAAQGLAQIFPPEQRLAAKAHADAIERAEPAPIQLVQTPLDGESKRLQTAREPWPPPLREGPSTFELLKAANERHANSRRKITLPPPVEFPACGSGRQSSLDDLADLAFEMGGGREHDESVFSLDELETANVTDDDAEARREVS
jgi:hypothetical protein